MHSTYLDIFKSLLLSHIQEIIFFAYPIFLFSGGGGQGAGAASNAAFLERRQQLGSLGA